jgi:hypothetical protein
MLPVAGRLGGLRVMVSLGLLALGQACTTAEVRPIGAAVTVPPEYVSMSHPKGFEVSDLRALFLDPKSPKLESIQGCDSDYRKLRELTTIEDEIREGAREMVTRFPVQYHWCFYGKILELENAFKNEPYIDLKQKNILTTYAFLVPLARAFLHVFKDSRYLRWSVQHYRHLSEWNFYRRLELSPETTSELVEVANPFGLWKDSAPVGERSVLKKYHLAHSAAPETSNSQEKAAAAQDKSSAPTQSAVPADTTVRNESDPVVQSERSPAQSEGPGKVQLPSEGEGSTPTSPSAGSPQAPSDGKGSVTQSASASENSPGSASGVPASEATPEKASD